MAPAKCTACGADRPRSGRNACKRPTGQRRCTMCCLQDGGCDLHQPPAPPNQQAAGAGANAAAGAAANAGAVVNPPAGGAANGPALQQQAAGGQQPQLPGPQPDQAAVLQSLSANMAQMLQLMQRMDARAQQQQPQPPQQPQAPPQLPQPASNAVAAQQPPPPPGPAPPSVAAAPPVMVGANPSASLVASHPASLPANPPHAVHQQQQQQAPQPPASHLAAFPPPLNGANPADLFNAAQGASQVSSPPTLPPHAASTVFTFAGQSQNVYLNSQRQPADQHDAIELPVFPGLPQRCKPVPPTAQEKPPTTRDEINALLGEWLKGLEGLVSASMLAAYYRYCNKVVDFATKVSPPSKAWDYHLTAFAAAEAHRYHPAKDGDVCIQAFVQDILPYTLRTDTAAKDRRSTFRKRRFDVAVGAGPTRSSQPKRPQAGQQRSAPPQMWCSFHHSSGHSDAECDVQNAQRRHPPGDGGAGRRRPQPSPASSSASGNSANS